MDYGRNFKNVAGVNFKFLEFYYSKLQRENYRKLTYTYQPKSKTTIFGTYLLVFEGSTIFKNKKYDIVSRSVRKVELLIASI